MPEVICCRARFQAHACPNLQKAATTLNNTSARAPEWRQSLKALAASAGMRSRVTNAETRMFRRASRRNARRLARRIARRKAEHSGVPAAGTLSIIPERRNAERRNADHSGVPDAQLFYDLLSMTAQHKEGLGFRV